MANQIDDYVKRPVRYQNIDGLGELTLGILLIVIAPLDLFKEAAPSSFWHHWVLLLICLVALLAALRYARRALRARITHPRTGYVRYRRTTPWIAGVTGAAFAFGIGFGLRHLAPNFSAEGWMPLVSSALWGLLYALLTQMDAAWRWIVLVAMVAVPPAIATLPFSRPLLNTLPYLAQGIIFSLSGAITLTLYLRRNPIPEQVGE
jgi:hypothetical protein